MSVNIPNTEVISATRELKGKHVLIGFLMFFGVIIAVNFTMARLASTSLKSSVSYGAHTLVLSLYDADGNILIADALQADIGRPAFEQEDKVLDFMLDKNGIGKIQ